MAIARDHLVGPFSGAATSNKDSFFIEEMNTGAVGQRVRLGVGSAAASEKGAVKLVYAERCSDPNPLMN
jgi:hypothetical protein